MTELTSRQRAVLRSLAQTIRPVLQIGHEGVTDRVARTVEDALNRRELLKVRILDTAPGTAQELGESLVAGIPDAQLVQVIGRTLVVFRRHPENPEITLPSI